MNEQEVRVVFTYVNGSVSRRQMVFSVPRRVWAIPSLKLGTRGAVPKEPEVLKGIEQVEGLLTQLPEAMNEATTKQACKLARRAGIAEASRDLQGGSFADEQELTERFLARMGVHYFLNELRHFQSHCPNGDSSQVYKRHKKERCIADPRLPHFIAGYQRAVMFGLQKLV